MRRFLSHHLLTSVLTVAFATTLPAAVTTFTAEADFLSGISGAAYYTETFETLPEDPLDQSLNWSDNSFSYTTSAITSTLWKEENAKVGNYALSTLLESNISISFTGQAVYAFGGYIGKTIGNPQLASGNITLQVNYADSTTESFTYAASLSQIYLSDIYFGVISDRQISSVQINREAGYLVIDNFTVAGEAIPEPASLGLLSLGALALFRRRKA